MLDHDISQSKNRTTSIVKTEEAFLGALFGPKSDLPKMYLSDPPSKYYPKVRPIHAIGFKNWRSCKMSTESKVFHLGEGAKRSRYVNSQRLMARIGRALGYNPGVKKYGIKKIFHTGWALGGDGMDVVFVLNCGSSSIKFQLIEPEAGDIHLKGLAENLNTPRATLKWADGSKALSKGDYSEALSEILQLLGDEKILAIGHRVVHGGESFNASIKIDEGVLKKIKECNHLAPLHNPVNALGIEIMEEKFPQIPQVAVFDTAFHQSMPSTAYLYALPYEYYEKYQVRRYGFHGTSHRYVVQKGAEEVGKTLEASSFISCHLGNGCSIAAVKGGKSLDTSMGLTPLEGLVMGQRSGDLDPSIVEFLAEKLQKSSKDVIGILNNQSGLLGISGISEDMRLLTESKNPQAKLAIDIFCYRLAKYIAAYLVPLQTVDGIIFTGGIGENATAIRDRVMEHLKPFSLRPLVIPTNEELMIARDAAAIVKGAS